MRIFKDKHGRFEPVRWCLEGNTITVRVRPDRDGFPSGYHLAEFLADIELGVWVEVYPDALSDEGL